MGIAEHARSGVEAEDGIARTPARPLEQVMRECAQHVAVLAFMMEDKEKQARRLNLQVILRTCGQEGMYGTPRIF